MASMPGSAPIVVNSAGCGASMKEYGRLLGTPEAEAFAARVRGLLRVGGARRAFPRRGRKTAWSSSRIRATSAMSRRPTARSATVLGAAYDLHDTDDEGLCCGAGGAYAALQPELSGAIRDRKVAALRRAGADAKGAVVASANPGCVMHLRGAGLDVRHPADLLAEALDVRP